MDTIFIREFRVDAWVGIYEWETQRPQTLEMDIEIGIPGNEVGRTDHIYDTVNYGEVVERIGRELADKRFKLLEALAEHVCAIITGDFRAPWVRLSVAKLGHIRGVSVHIMPIGSLARSSVSPAIMSDHSETFFKKEHHLAIPIIAG